MYYSCPHVPCFQQTLCRSRAGATTDATGRFCVTCTFSKHAHLLVKPVKEDQLCSSEAGIVHLFLFCFAVLPSEAKRKPFSIQENLQLCSLTLSCDLLRTFYRGAGEVWKTNRKPHLDKVLGFCWHHRSCPFGQWSIEFLSNLTADSKTEAKLLPLLSSSPVHHEHAGSSIPGGIRFWRSK